MLESFEDGLDPVTGNAGAGVRDDEPQDAGSARIAPGSTNAQGFREQADVTLLRELRCVVDEIDEDLSQLGRIRLDCRRRVHGHVD